MTSAVLLALASIAAWPALLTAAQKPQPAVRGSWVGAPSSIQACKTVNMVLHVEANADVMDLTTEILPSRGIEIVGGTTRRRVRSLPANGVLDLPVRARVVANGEWTLGARLTARRGTDVEVSGAVLNIVAAKGKAVFGLTAPGRRDAGPIRNDTKPPDAPGGRSNVRTLCSPLRPAPPSRK